MSQEDFDSQKEIEFNNKDDSVDWTKYGKTGNESVSKIPDHVLKAIFL